MNIYETDRLLAEYLLFHYGAPNQVLPWPNGPHDALWFPERCIAEGFNASTIPVNARALDLGCAVGGSTFTLTKYCAEVVGIDLSQKFIAAAQRLQTQGSLSYEIREEGNIVTPAIAQIQGDVFPERATFLAGDATTLPATLGKFDVILAANLVDRLQDPRKLLRQLPDWMNAGGQLVLVSPYTWMEDFTPVENWLGGYMEDNRPVRALETLQNELSEHFEFIRAKDLPFLIREHARKYQWSVAQCSTWRRRR